MQHRRGYAQHDADIPTAAGSEHPHVAALAQLEPGDSIPPAAAIWVVDAFRRYADSAGALPLDVCFGIRRRADKTTAKQLRDSYLRMAYSVFQPERHRINANSMLQFSRAVKAFRKIYQQFQRTGRLPSGRFELRLYLAFDAYRVPVSES